MPVMIPPGQGTTVTLPQGGQGVVPAPPRTAAPPSPFHQTHGPDLLIMPHQEDQDQPTPGPAPQPQPQQQPPVAQFRRNGKMMKLARRALKLNRLLGVQEMDAFAQAASKRFDDAPHVALAGRLEDAGDPRSYIIQEALRAKQEHPLDADGFVSDPTIFLNSYRSRPDQGGYYRNGQRFMPTYRYTSDGGWLYSLPDYSGHTYDTHTVMRYIPSIRTWEDYTNAPSYTVRVPNEVAQAIHEHLDPHSRPEPWIEHPDRPGKLLGLD